ncbi:PAS domain-containing sensor histidine kinase [Methanobacterium sp. ACI-7]|uniref:PAS domain-containing sensor histidine kinase n=1 Tax=unclassified Methanobacterium TaxID=2627676 RepID=UPI0039C1BBE1
MNSEDYYTIFENMQEGITVYQMVYDRNNEIIDLIIKYANPASSTSRIFINRKVTGKRISKIYGEEVIQPLIDEVNEIVSSGEVKKYDTYSALLDSYFSISAFSPAKNLYVTLTSDISDQKRAEKILKESHEMLEIEIQKRTAELLEALEEKEILLKEVHHRVKNNLQLISSLLNLQIPYTDSDVGEILKESQNRVRSIAMIHEKLYQSKSLDSIDFTDYIQNMVLTLYQTYNVNPDKLGFELELDNLILNIETCIPCALILTELLTNSIKHAFPATEGRGPVNGTFESPEDLGGTIRIELVCKDKEVTLKIKDNGIGIPEKIDIKKPDSFGLQLVNLLINQLRGTVELRKEYGTEFIINFEELNYEKRI